MEKKPSTHKVALITGAARRIGAEIARRLHEAGMNVIIHYNTSDAEAQALCDSLNDQRKHSAIKIQADLTQLSSINFFMEQCVNVWQRLDVVVNNASRFYPTPMGTVTTDQWDDLFDSNLKSVFFLVQAAIPALTKAQGHIINITDIHGEYPLKGYSAYCLTKSALLMMTKVLAKELGPTVRVNAVSPGAILWPEGENALSPADKAKIIAETALKRPGSPADIASAVLYFAREGGYITGQVLAVEGGRVL